MNQEDLVDRYLAAWNLADADAVLDLLHDGATYYDAFWMEYCTGRDLRQYLVDTFAEENYRYRLDGELILVDDGIAFRYVASDPGPAGGAEVYRGAEIFDMR
ncbi:MAG: nuclear transport factor 2 family protein, partial [Woeseiaceae bacterium]|nr:nuclear transport factor 2 family protein [Woeseiaceae bacterium]